ncbi:hypothetical protein PBI_DAMIEN_88 [Mycobacterium phage Damien]|uniref:Uncharacterized protein n=1 Tax=Mycobacterium phage Konstantine TaxID=563121 RepID=B5U4W6_9CAUD|nr:gp91 [Mycobacterium phage Konstantine]YP_009007369.1 hypothetical protein CH12_gp88 [Mycobacterium phage Oaker]YP_009044077.1 hypothetical protein HL12_gp88 [Mycobacterium phage Damien]AVO26065.1 hypothetical protein SEA_THUMB_89 [Mycobacterium phage Thumb]QDH84951.1 hypothetical protein SEA_Phreeze_87 [Mycobacterium phage Phreeze]QLF83971.1 hypothetical protein SEA_BECKERTON_87 [Mycobacterium phage Beckerton]ACI12506.1 hypothetical protein KONSTANTINE_91 [Mycobacterium phage Konstantine]
MKLEDTHGGYHGKSLQDKIRDDLDEAYKMHRNEEEAFGQDTERNDRFAEGIAHALGVLRGTDADVEWEAAQERYDNPVTPEPVADEPQVCCPDHNRPIINITNFTNVTNIVNSVDSDEEWDEFDDVEGDDDFED